MNVDRSSPAQALAAATGRSSSKTASPDAHEFSFDTGDAPQATPETRRGAVRERHTDDVQAARPHDAHRPVRESRKDRDVPHADEPRANAHANARDHANAATRNNAPRDHDADADSRDGASASAAAEPSDRDATAQASADPTTPAAESLPDRMLALLTGDWAATAPKPTPSTDVAPGAALATLQAVAASVTPGQPTAPSALLTPEPATAQPAGGAANPAGAVLLQALSLPTDAAAASPAASTPAGDAFAALAALADNGKDRGIGASTDTAAPAAPGIAFNPLLAKGADAPMAAVRDVVVAMPAAAPLALDADFDDGLSQRISWMADQRLDRAEIRVTPEALGPIDIRLQMDGHRVNAQFHAANADVRQALESGMDRLRDLLGRQGMELGQAQVGAGGRQAGDGRPNGAPTPFGVGSGLGGDAQPQVTTVRTLRARGLIDEYA